MKGIAFTRPITFVTGVALLTIGVLLHVPDFLSMESMGYRMAEMPMSRPMLAGMVSIVAGLGLSVYGLLPRWVFVRAYSAPATRYYTRAMDNAR